MFDVFESKFDGVIAMTTAVAVGHYTIQIGALIRNKIWEQESFMKWLTDEFKCSEKIETTAADLLQQIEKVIEPKGLLVHLIAPRCSIACSLVSGEVREDFDVKMEIYKLMGV